MSLSEAVLRIALYYDVFAWPLTRAELTRFVRPDDPAAIGQACEALLEGGQLQAHGPYLHVPGRDDAIARRHRSSRAAELLWPAARRSAAVLARFPFVRGVLITGGLSKGAIGEDSDVDFLLIVQPGRVWLTKSLLQAWRKALPDRVRECFCTNYLLAEDELSIDEHNAFTAMELATAVPMYGAGACTRLLETNAWAERFVPGFAWSIRRARNAPELPARRGASIVEGLAALGGDDLDERALSLWNRYWDRKYAWLDEATRAKRFKRRRDIATNHLNDFQGWVLEEWVRRLDAHGVPAEPLR